MKSNNVRSWIKFILIFSGAVILFFVVLFALALVVLDDDDYRQLAIWGVEQLTGYRMLVEGRFLVDLSAEPSLTVDGIRFEAFAGSPAPPLTSIGHFYFKMALKPLLRGTAVIRQLRIEDVTADNIYFRRKNDKESRLSNLLPDFMVPVFEHVALKNIKLART